MFFARGHKHIKPKSLSVKNVALNILKENGDEK